jgi:hypothetical protein
MTTGFNPRTIHCSSKYASINWDSNMTKCTFQLNRPLNVPSEYELCVSVLSASIPYSYYSIPTTAVTYVKNAATVNWATIPQGNWSGSDIAAKLTNSDVTVTFVNQTGLFSFVNNNPTYTLTIAPSAILGIRTNLAVAVGATGYSQYFPDISGTRFINILSSLNTECLTTGTMPQGTGALLSLPVNCAPNGFIIYTPQNLVTNRLKESYISQFDITICDSDMQPLNLNGVAWEIDILVTVIIPPNLPPEYNQAPLGLDLFGAQNGYVFNENREKYVASGKRAGYV